MRLLKIGLSFGALILIVTLMQYLLLKIVFNYGFTPDDWGLLLFYKSLGDDPLSKIFYVWSVKGAYTTSQVYFIGILNDFFGLNYQAYHITNVILKILATLSVYPLIVVIFKRRSLAFLTTILYGMSYMGSRSLEYVVKGTDYLAIIPMNIFFIIYYYIVREKVKGIRWFILMSFFWFTALMISPIRIYPILALIPLIELFLWMQNRSRKNFLNSLKRLSMLYMPFVLIYLYKPSSILSFLHNPPIIFKAISDGNWHLLLTPFQGVGLTLFVTRYWGKVFGVVSIESLNSFIGFLLGGPLFIFGLFTALLLFIKLKQRLRGFAVILGITFIFSISAFIIANHLHRETEIIFDPNKIYAVLIGGFMLAISLASFLEWKAFGKKDNLLLVLWMSPLMILLYTVLIWLLAPFGIGFEGQQGYYLTVPAIVASLFLSGILVSILDKAFSIKVRIFRFSLFLVSVIFFTSIYLMNSFSSYNYYLLAGKDGRYSLDQERIYNLVLSKLVNVNYSEPVLFYFDASENSEQSTYHYEELLFHSLPIRLLLRDDKLNNGCIGAIYRGIDHLAKFIAVKTGIMGFLYQGQCIINNKGGNTEGVFFKIDNFYAFKLKGRELIDIKNEILKKLEIK